MPASSSIGRMHGLVLIESTDKFFRKPMFKNNDHKTIVHHQTREEMFVENKPDKSHMENSLPQDFHKKEEATLRWWKAKFK